MRYFLGIDGGGTKTAFCITDETGFVLAEHTDVGTSYRHRGFDAVCETLELGVNTVLEKAKLTLELLTGICFGAPCYGESRADDAILLRLVTDLFAPLPVRIVNDVVVGYAGALALKSGVHIVAGTGAIAFGRDPSGATARAGGWDEFFSDEGSCYWLGKKAMALFAKQSDGRLPRGPLYDVMREHFELEEDIDFVTAALELAKERESVAKLQLLLLKAAELKDSAAEHAYEEAAQELAQLVTGIRASLRFATNPLPVSYSGGLFRTGERILTPLRKLLTPMGCQLTPARFVPHVGAALLAIESFAPDVLKQLLD